MKREMTGEQFLTKTILELYPSIDAFADTFNFDREEIHQLLNNPLEQAPGDRVLMICQALQMKVSALVPYIAR